jgi:hypothetical protein
LCSLDPKDDSKAKFIKRQVEIIRIPNPSESTVDYISAKLSDYSKVLLEFAEPFLRGNFSQWLEIYEYKVNSSRSARLRSGKQEFVRTVSKNKDEHVSIFQDDFDYLEQLKREYGKENC